MARHYHLMITNAHTTDWAWGRVKAALRRRGTSFNQVALALGMARSNVYATRHKPNARVQAAIAAALGRRPQEIWPSRYTTAGLPVRPSVWRRWAAQQQHGAGSDAA